MTTDCYGSWQSTLQVVSERAAQRFTGFAGGPFRSGHSPTHERAFACPGHSREMRTATRPSAGRTVNPLLVGVGDDLHDDVVFAASDSDSG